MDADNALPGRKTIEELLAVKNEAVMRRASNRQLKESADKTPPSAGSGASDFVIGIRYDANQDMKFRVKGSTNVRKLAQVFASQRGLDASKVSLLLHGSPLDPESEIASLSLDRDVVEFLDAVVADESRGNSAAQRDNKWVSVTMRDFNHELSRCRVKRNAALGKLFEAYRGTLTDMYTTLVSKLRVIVERKSLHDEDVHFLLGKQKLLDESTPEDLEVSHSALIFRLIITCCRWRTE